MSKKKTTSAVAIKKQPAAASPKKGAQAATRKPAARQPAMTVVKPAAAASASKPPSAASAKNLYSVHPSITMVRNWVNGLRDKTGRSLEEWVALVQATGPADTKDRRAWLKDKYGLGTNSAWWIVERADPAWDPSLSEDDPESYLRAAPRYVEEMYAGGKASLRPLHDRLIELGRSMGKDVRICPCKTIIPFYRHHVFAEIKPASRTRIDFGFALRDTPASGRLIDTGGWESKNRITHRIPISSLKEIDNEVERWLRFAYELDA